MQSTLDDDPAFDVNDVSEDEVDMIIDDVYRKSVGYIVAKVWNAKKKRFAKEPIGTFFSVTLHETSGGWADYAITAGHVLEGLDDPKCCRGMFYRVNTEAGTSEDIPLIHKNWIFHKSADVAACQISFPPRIDVVPLMFGPSARESRVNVEPGKNIFFVGLFALFPGEDSVNPVIRFGKICLPRTRISAGTDQLPNRQAEVYLAEAWSWGGESGSPAFSYYDHYEETEDATTRGKVHRSRVTASQVDPPLLGLLHGQFRQGLPILNKGADTSLKVSTSAGIAAIVPADKIYDLLMHPRFVKRRKAIKEEDDRAAREKATLKPC